MAELQGIKSPRINKRYRIPKGQSKMDNPETRQRKTKTKTQHNTI
jgi:hypothetical protein